MRDKRCTTSANLIKTGPIAIVEIDHAHDANAANHAAELAAQRKALGRPVDMRVTFIAGIAISRRATLATRNTKHFDDLTTPVVNPWARP